MRAGHLRHRVRIERKVVTRNSYHEEIVTWRLVGEVWGSVEPLRGREFFESKQQQAEVDTRVRMRFRRGVLPTMRVCWDGHVYDVESVIRPFERNREMQLMCREVVGREVGS